MNERRRNYRSFGQQLGPLPPVLFAVPGGQEEEEEEAALRSDAPLCKGRLPSLAPSRCFLILVT